MQYRGTVLPIYDYKDETVMNDWLINWVYKHCLQLRKATYDNPQPCWYIIGEGDSKSFWMDIKLN